MKRHNENMKRYRNKKRRQSKKVKQFEAEGIISFEDDYVCYDKVGKPCLEETSRGRNLQNVMNRIGNDRPQWG